MAAIGRADLDVYTRPRVAILSTGNEVIEPGTPLGPGQIFDVNRFTLAARDFRFKLQLPGRIEVNQNLMTVAYLASQNQARHRRFNFALDCPFQRPGAVRRIVARADQMSASPIR